MKRLFAIILAGLLFGSLNSLHVLGDVLPDTLPSYNAQLQFSGTQGGDNWRYQYKDGTGIVKDYPYYGNVGGFGNSWGAVTPVAYNNQYGIIADEQFYLLNSVSDVSRVFVAPYSGTINIANSKLTPDPGAGVMLSIEKNGNTLFPASGDMQSIYCGAGYYTLYTDETLETTISGNDVKATNIEVTKGDSIAFRARYIKGSGGARLYWIPVVTYTELKHTYISLTQTAVNLTQLSKHQLTAILEGDSIYSAEDITWTTSNPSIANVTDSGNVISTGIGECTITAALPDNSYATCTITVSGVISSAITGFANIQGKNDWRFQQQLISEDIIDLPNYSINAWTSNNTSLWNEATGIKIYSPDDRINTIMTYVAPYSGMIDISALSNPKTQGGGLEADICIKNNGQVIWPEIGDWKTIDYSQATSAAINGFNVKEGDNIQFVIHRPNSDANTNTSVYWTPFVKYTSFANSTIIKTYADAKNIKTEIFSDQTSRVALVLGIFDKETKKLLDVKVVDNIDLDKYADVNTLFANNFSDALVKVYLFNSLEKLTPLSEPSIRDFIN